MYRYLGREEARNLNGFLYETCMKRKRRNTKQIKSKNPYQGALCFRPGQCRCRFIGPAPRFFPLVSGLAFGLAFAGGGDLAFVLAFGFAFAFAFAVTAGAGDYLMRK